MSRLSSALERFDDWVEETWERFRHWWNRLPRGVREPIEQTLHFVFLGLVPAALGTAAAAWALNHWREFYHQAPIERIDDTERDMRFALYGAVVGQAVNTALGVIATAKVFGHS